MDEINKEDNNKPEIIPDKDLPDNILMDISTKEGYYRDEKITYIKNGERKTRKESIKVMKNPNKVIIVKYLQGRNLIEIFSWKDSPERLMIAINHKHDTLSEYTHDDIIELKRAAMVLGNKKNITGEHCNKKLINKIEKMKRYNKVKDVIKYKV